MMQTRCALMLAFVCFQAPVHPVEGAVTTLQKSIRLYEYGKYDSTILVIRDHLRKHGKEEQTEQLVPLVTEALVRRGEFVSAHRLISMYRTKYPQSPFIPRLWYIEGIALAREEKYPGAITAFSMALKTGVSYTLDSLVILNTEKICMHMASEEFSELDARDIHRRLVEIMKFYEIEKLITLGQFAKAVTCADGFRQAYPRSRYGVVLREWITRAQEAKKGTLQIGLLAPISGEEEEIGKQVVQGAQLAISRLQPQNGQTVKCVVLDTRGNMMTTAQKTRELLDEHKVSVIIGPVLSQTATVTAAMLIDKPNVMISPTATDEGIADMGENVFQMNVTIGVLGRKIARYAIENLSIKEFVILAPRTAYGRILAASFKEELKKRNLELLAEEYYEEGANDYREQFQNIRKKLLTRHLERLSTERGTDFRGVITRRDSILYSDSTLAVGGLFIPGDAEDVVMLAPQVMFHRIRTQILGSSGWHQPKVLKDGKRYVFNAVISTSFELDQSGKEWGDFVKAYKKRYNTEPDRVAALGYDAATLVMKAIRETGGDDPKRIREVLARTDRFHGISGIVSFEEGRRANNECAVYKITESGFVRVQ
ncbi:MAG: ABC transporter substrate-binding protein [Chitinispirillaceae bacterium]|nr:ABC transporter substrate-binding protein [Chitinispirillaceae bacterium]